MKSRILHITASAVLCASVALAATPAIIVISPPPAVSVQVTGSNQGVNVTGPIIETATVVNSIATTASVITPGPQGPAGSGSVGGDATFSNVDITGYGSLNVGGDGGTNISNAAVDTGNLVSEYIRAYGTAEGTRVHTSDVVAAAWHTHELGNAHHLEPWQLFGTPTSAKEYPLFDTDGSVTFTRPLEVCGSDPATAVFDGARGPAGPSVFCNLSAVVQAVSYDSSGLNPTPALQPFALQVWQGAVRLIVTSYQYWTAGANNTIYGSSTSDSFTPSVKSVFKLMSTNNVVFAQGRYTSATGAGYCQASKPIAVSRPGTKGDKGDPGAASTVDSTSVLDALGTATDRTLLIQSNTPGEHTKLQINNSDAYIIVKVTDRGLIEIRTPGAVKLLTFNPTATELTLKTSSGRTIFSIISSAAGGTLTL